MIELLLTAAVFVLVLFYVLWILYLAVMNLKRAQDSNSLSNTVLVIGLPILALGYLIDTILNLLVMSIILFEIPKELTISARLKRHNVTSSGYRKFIVKLFELFLDPFDPSGNHI